LLLDLLPRLHPAATAGLLVGGQGSVVLLCSALGAPITGRAVGRWGRLPSLVTGITLLALALAGRLSLPNAWEPVLLPLLGLIHSLVVTSLTATALAWLTPRSSGLGAGLVLGGTGVAGSLSLLRFGSTGPVQLPALLLLLAVTTAAALGGCLLLELLRRWSRSAGTGRA
jgi:MFS family permease